MEAKGYSRTSQETWMKMAPGREGWRAQLANALAPVREWLFRELAPRTGETVLELGAGAGDTGFEAAAIVGETGRLISIDPHHQGGTMTGVTTTTRVHGRLMLTGAPAARSRFPLGLLATAVWLLILGALWAPAAVAADAGDLDTSFSADGRVTLDIAGGRDDFGRAVATQADGKVVAAASHQAPGAQVFALARFNLDGSLDTSFGLNGRVLLSFGNDDAVARAVAIQPDGKIVAAGWKYSRTDNSREFAFARFEIDGAVDQSFSGDGRVTTSFDRHDVDAAFAVAIQRNGRIVAAGVASDPSGTTTDFALARYDPDGTLDETFAGDGKQVTAFSGQDAAFAVAIEPNVGRVVVAGRTTSRPDSLDNLSFALAR